MNTKRYNRLAKQKARNSKRSYVTEIEDLQIIVAWLYGDLSEGRAARALGVDRVSLRTMRDAAVYAGVATATE
jgi:hypothetical protein